MGFLARQQSGLLGSGRQPQLGLLVAWTMPVILGAVMAATVPSRATTETLAAATPPSAAPVAAAVTETTAGAAVAPTRVAAEATTGSLREITTVRRIRLENHSINPITTRFMLRNLEEAEKEGSAFLLELDTPGGLVSSTKEIVKAFLAATVPVIVYVAPNGSSATSAGVFITVASNIAVMAPSTHIGAATPISLDGSGEKPRSRRTRSTETTGTQAVDGESTQPGTIRIVIRDDGKEEGGTESSAAAKMLNDTAAWAEATARTRGRNPQWTRDTVLEARSSTAEEALRLGVIDFIATSTADLYRLIDGRTVQTAKDPVVLRTANVPVMEPVTMSGQEQFLNFLADPTIAYLLISLGTLCIFIEFYNPGLIVPGLIGLISFLLAAVALNILPINIMAVVLIVVGVGLILLELKFPLFFVPTIGGIIFLIVGALLLIDEPRVLPGGYVPLGLAIGIGSGTGGILALLTGLTIRAHSRRVLTGMSSYEGETAEVVEDLNPRGTVFFGGTYWSATLVDETGQPAVGRTVAKGGLVRVKKVQHLRVEVQALEEEKPEKGAGQG